MASIGNKKRRDVPSVLSRDPFTTMRDEINHLMSHFWEQRDFGSNGISANPAMDVAEDELAYELRIDAPGMKTDDFDIQVQRNGVTVSGTRHEENEEENKTFHRIERRSGSFRRTVTLPCDINEDEVVAQYDDGVLTLKLPKAESNRAKRIHIGS